MHIYVGYCDPCDVCRLNIWLNKIVVLDHEAANRKYNLYKSTKIKRIEFVHYYGYKISIRSTRNHCKVKDHFIRRHFNYTAYCFLFRIVSFEDIESISKCLDLILA